MSVPETPLDRWRIAPDSIHIATEGPSRWFARQYCLKNGLNFTTSFHSRLPEYIAVRMPFPGIEKLLYRLLQQFHEPEKATLAPTDTVSRRLRIIGFPNVFTWSRGVDHNVFRPKNKNPFIGYSNPIYLNAGRVAVEKYLTAFLDIDLPGTKVMAGDGPPVKFLKKRDWDVVFTGYLTGEALAEALSAADVFVFPSRTHTFGLVMIEALACGTPVAAFPVEGPIDVIKSGKVGALDKDLEFAVEKALLCESDDCIAYAKTFAWLSATEMFENYIQSVTASKSKGHLSPKQTLNQDNLFLQLTFSPIIVLSLYPVSTGIILSKSIDWILVSIDLIPSHQKHNLVK